MNFPKSRHGQLLLELLIAVTVSAIILGLGGNLFYVSLQSNKISDEKDTALALASETMEAVQAVAFERWQNLYSDTTHSSGGTTYYPSRVSDAGRSYKWVTHTPDSSTRWKTTASINSVSALSSRNVWIAGDDLSGAGASTVWQYVGDTDSPSTSTGWTQRSPVNDKNFYAIETLSSTEVWAGGQSGALYKWDGSTWTSWGAAGKCNTGATDIRGISASSSSNIWIVGASGKVWKVTDASTCTLVGGGGVPTGNLWRVSALDSTHIWMVGDSGKVYSYSGTTWSEHSGDSGASWGSGVTMNSVSIVSSSNVWISGSAGNVWSYNGTSWTSHKPADNSTRWGTSSSINGVTAYSSTWVVIVGANGEVWEYDGTTWSPHYSGSSVTACETNSLCGLSANLLGVSNKYSTELWVVGASGNVWQFQGTKWQYTSGSESKALGTNTFVRSFYVQNVCRSTAGAITTVTACGGSDVEDPSTQKVTVTVTWTGGQTITMSNYISRWRNTPCLQTQWSSTDSGTTSYLCPSTVYKSVSNLSLTTDTQVVITAPLGIMSTNGTLTSAIFDSTGITSRGSAYNSIMWLGNALSGSQKVWFQIGVYDNDTPSTGILTFYGATGGTCNSSNWFDPGAPSVPIDVKDCVTNLNNKRYFVYKMKLCPSNSNSLCTTGGGLLITSPTVKDVIINTSP